MLNLLAVATRLKLRGAVAFILQVTSPNVHNGHGISPFQLAVLKQDLIVLYIS
jgi:hypothetical protein